MVHQKNVAFNKSHVNNLMTAMIYSHHHRNQSCFIITKLRKPRQNHFFANIFVFNIITFVRKFKFSSTINSTRISSIYKILRSNTRLHCFALKIAKKLVFRKLPNILNSLGEIGNTVMVMSYVSVSQNRKPWRDFLVTKVLLLVHNNK